MMSTPPHWTRLHHCLLQVATHLQLGYHITLRFSQYIVNNCWKGDDDAIILDLVPAPDGPWINLCDHDKVLRHLFWANLAMYRVGP
ncbi:hypothetical protein BDA96_10G210500 [Sorghum bicolor]|uniref:Uncharacterized protein n=1 Tax=Sorghum bicolor TaxID=4558 RepID=A0A921Q5D5_SORBI|nr:hypothetical protein BDA96_10G210500 [Sorghum bicolor]